MQRFIAARIEPVWPGGPRTVAENRKPDLPQFSRVAMCSPDNDSRQTGGLRFEGRQISDAAFILPAAVIDHENVARLRILHCLQKHIDTPKMSCRKCSAREAAIGNHRRNSGRRDSKGNLQAQRRVGDERRRKFGKACSQQLVVHHSILREVAVEGHATFRKRFEVKGTTFFVLKTFAKCRRICLSRQISQDGAIGGHR